MQATTPDDALEQVPTPPDGPGWAPRAGSTAHELSPVWADCGDRSEGGRLHAVLLHWGRP